MKILAGTVKNFSTLIVEDQKLVLQGLSLVLRQHFPNVRIHEASDGEHAFTLLEIHKVDIVLLDIGLPGMHGVEIAQKILRAYPNVKILIVTQYTGEAMIKNLLRIGVHSFFFKSSTSHELEKAVTTVLGGSSYLPEIIKPALIPTTHIPAISFNKRESEILLLLKNGRSSKEISQSLNLTEYTINSYREDMLKKTHTGNVAQLISFAYENGILG